MSELNVHKADVHAIATTKGGEWPEVRYDSYLAEAMDGRLLGTVRKNF